MQWLVSEARTWDATGSNPCRYFFFSCTSPAPVHIGTRLQSKIMGSYSLAAANQSATGHLKQISVSKSVMFFYGNKRDSMDVLSERRGVRDRSRKKRGSGKTMRGKDVRIRWAQAASFPAGRGSPPHSRLERSPRAESRVSPRSAAPMPSTKALPPTRLAFPHILQAKRWQAIKSPVMHDHPAASNRRAHVN